MRVGFVLLLKRSQPLTNDHDSTVSALFIMPVVIFSAQFTNTVKFIVGNKYQANYLAQDQVGRIDFCSCNCISLEACPRYLSDVRTDGLTAAAYREGKASLIASMVCAGTSTDADFPAATLSNGVPFKPLSLEIDELFIPAAAVVLVEKAILYTPSASL
jgi:hypothetical protein